MRWFGAACLVNAVGTGAYYPFSLLFFQAELGFSLSRIGVGLTIAALIALPALPLIGRLIDRFGPKWVLFGAALMRAAAFALYLFVGRFWEFVALSVVVALSLRTEQTASPVLASTLAGEGQQGRWLALSRSMFNAGFGCGALLAGLAASGRSDDLATVGAVNAVCIAVATLLYLPLAAGRSTPAPARERNVAADKPWRHGKFRAVVAAGAGLWMIAIAVESAMPVYLMRHLDTGPWLIGVLFAMNTVLLAVCQVPVAYRLEKYRPGALVAIGAVLHIGLLAALGIAGGFGAGTQVGLLLCGMALYTLGELISSHSLLVLLTSIAPEHRRGSFLAFNQMFIGLANAVTPLMVTLFLDHSATGLWWALAACAMAVTVIGRTWGASAGRGEPGNAPRSDVPPGVPPGVRPEVPSDVPSDVVHIQQDPKERTTR
ncbi:MFS transporter [Streptomyces sp. NBC_01142]|uniref:MFS transporter n=1 Tax=Streptomyces sp. NBC_01142 TaxID=2975865 RepID=UPI00225AC03D|nr:MFS transporter [Streptomyces sp. NBC_01142]MCX4823166.1 MFS transporter [Streptomyces sp. NBC_01142]